MDRVLYKPFRRANYKTNKIKPTNKQEFEQAIAKIGYKVKGVYPNSFVYDNNCKNTGICVLSDHIEFKQEIEANAKLVSLAPELLDFVIEVMETTTDKIRYEKSVELIKKALG